MTVETIENRWDILYRDYPHIYDEFASVPYNPDVVSVMIALFKLAGKNVVDVGCGSGKSAFRFAKDATKVIGIEPEQAMLDLAREIANRDRVTNDCLACSYDRTILTVDNLG